MLRQETCKEERKVPVTPPVVASNTGLENQYLLPADSTQTGSDYSGHSTQQLESMLCTALSPSESVLIALSNQCEVTVNDSAVLFALLLYRSLPC